MDIKRRVDYYVKRCRTRDPYEMAEALGISVICEELGGINGYYSKLLRMKQIHVNCNLPEHEMRYAAAHELGHAVLHPDSNTSFLRNHTLLSVNKLENQAHQFALELLIPDEDLQEYLQRQYNVECLASIYGLPAEYIEMRLQTFSCSCL